jgi:hypothetical protein
LGIEDSRRGVVGRPARIGTNHAKIDRWA